MSGACPNAKRVIDASGLVVAPGFIDVHAHLDGYAYGARLAAAQGITTTVGGNCGLSRSRWANFSTRSSARGI